MKHFENKKQIKSKFYSPIVITFLIILIILLSKGVWAMYGKERQSALMRREAENRLSGIMEQKKNLEDKVGSLEGSVGIEKEIRSKFNVIKPGEHVVMIVHDEEVTVSTTTSDGFWANLWRKVW